MPSSVLDAIDSRWLSTYRDNLSAWFEAHRRDLPWRKSRDPYAIWISEVMLQQTQVATVLEYFKRFTARFPTVSDLAKADEQDVLAQWAGLGYYRRARQLHAASKVIHEQHGGVFPRDFEEILALPGVGRYTAGAVASFAYDDSQPIVEANTIRLFARLTGLQAMVQLSSSQKQLWGLAEKLVADVESGAGDLNQAAMELGSLVCTPTNPSCSSCPLRSICAAHQQQLVEQIPQVRKKPKPIERNHVGLLALKTGDSDSKSAECASILLRQNESGQWWEGLWDIPRLELGPQNDFAAVSSEPPMVREAPEFQLLNEPQRPAADTVLEQFNLAFEVPVSNGKFLKTWKHAITRYRISLHVFEASTGGFELNKLDGNWIFCRLDAEPPPLTSPAQKIFGYLQKRLLP